MSALDNPPDCGRLLWTAPKTETTDHQVTGGGVAKLVRITSIINEQVPSKYSAKLVIDRLRNLASTPNAVVRRCVLGKDT